MFVKHFNHIIRKRSRSTAIASSTFEISFTALSIGRFTPLGVIYAFFSPLFHGGFDPVSLIPAAAYTAIGAAGVQKTLKQTVLGAEIV